MSHELEIGNDGKASMFFVGETPWHKLGTKLLEAPTSLDAIRLAGLDWDVETTELFSSLSEVKTHRAVHRTSDGRLLGVVGAGYHPLQNREAFSFFDPFIEAGEASYETAGALRNGARVWILAKLNREPMVITKDDPVYKYLLLSNGHDGSLAVRTGFTPIRAVCANTLAHAHSPKVSKLLRIRHTANVVETLENVREIMNLANAEFEATAEQYRALASREINSDDLKKYVQKIFKAKAVAQAEEDGTEPPTPVKVLEAVEANFEGGRGHEQAGATWWGAYNAINEYLGYERGESDESRLNQMWYGQSAALNQRALQYAYNVVTA